MCTKYKNIRLFVLVALLLSLPNITPRVEAKAISPQETTLSTAAQTDSEHIELIGHLGGMALSIAVQGNYAYAGFGPEFAILDITNPAAIQRIGWLLAPGEVWDISIVGDYAFIAYSGDQQATGLQVINIQDPTSPVSEFVHEFAFCGRSAYISVGTTAAYIAYTACDSFGQNAGSYIYQLDISEPTEPSIVSSQNYFMSSFNEIAAGDGWLYALWQDVSGDYIKTFDVSDPLGIVEISTTRVANDSSAVALAGDYAFLAAKDNGMQIIDISDPTDLTPVITHTLPGTAQDIFIAGNFAYLAAGDAGLQIVDVTDPLNPLDAGSYTANGTSTDVFVTNGTAYLVNGWAGIEIVQLPDLTQAGLLELPEKFNDLAVRNPYAFAAAEDGFWVLDLSNPAMPVAIAHIETVSSCTSLVLSNNYAYAACPEIGLRIMDISDPQAPGEAAVYDLPGDTNDLAVADHTLCAARSELVMLDISNPLAPAEISSFATGAGSVNAVAVSGDYAHLALDNGNLAILDISDPSSPTEIGGYNPADRYGLDQEATAIQVQDNIVYLTTVEPPPTPLARFYVGDTWLIDVSDPENPALISSISTSGAPFDVDVENNTAVIAYEREGLRLYDVSNSAVPLERGSYDPSENIYGVNLSDGLIYLYNNSLFITQYVSSTTQIYLPVTPQLLSDNTTQETQ